MTNRDDRLFQCLKPDRAQLRRRYTDKAEKRGFHKGQGLRDSHPTGRIYDSSLFCFFKALSPEFFFIKEVSKEEKENLN